MPSVPQRSAGRRRLTVGLLAAVTVAAGLLVHRFGSGIVSDIVGDALYASLVYLLIVFVLPRRTRSLCAALAILFCTAVELLQLTDVPAKIASAVPPAVLVLGSGFDRRDLIVYAFAAVCVMLLDVLVSRGLRRAAARTR